MTNGFHRESAKIVPFAGRTVASRSTVGRTPAAVISLALQRLPRVEFGSGWYHDAAIEQDAVAAKQ